MKKTLIIGSAIALSLVGASAAQAETATVTATVAATTTRPAIKAQMKAEIKDIRAEIKTEIQAKKQELQAKRASTTAEIKLAKVAETIKQSKIHLANEISRLNDAKSRIDSRIAKFDQAGANTVAVKADLALAVTAIAGAQAKVDAVGSVQPSTDTKAFADSLRKAVKDAQTSINDAQKALIKVTSDMKGLEASVKASKTASSTRE